MSKYKQPLSRVLDFTLTAVKRDANGVISQFPINLGRDLKGNTFHVIPGVTPKNQVPLLPDFIKNAKTFEVKGCTGQCTRLSEKYKENGKTAYVLSVQHVSTLTQIFLDLMETSNSTTPFDNVVFIADPEFQFASRVQHVDDERITQTGEDGVERYRRFDAKVSDLGRLVEIQEYDPTKAPAEVAEQNMAARVANAARSV